MKAPATFSRPLVLSAAIFLVAILTIFSAQQAYAIKASIGNGVMIIHTEVDPGKLNVIDRTIKVINNNDYDINVSLKPTGELVGITDVIDDALIIPPGESVDARFRIVITEPGVYYGEMLVSFRSADPEIRDSGLGLSSKITVDAASSDGSYVEDKDTAPQEQENTTVIAPPVISPPAAPIDEEDPDDKSSNEGVGVKIGSGAATTPSITIPNTGTGAQGAEEYTKYSDSIPSEQLDSAVLRELIPVMTAVLLAIAIVLSIAALVVIPKRQEREMIRE